MIFRKVYMGVLKELKCSELSTLSGQAGRQVVDVQGTVILVTKIAERHWIGVGGPYLHPQARTESQQATKPSQSRK